MRWINAPEGTRDALFGECSARRARESAVGELFSGAGFREVSTPVIEYYDLFVRTGSPLPEESMFKLTDRSGRICVLRPDSTTPIARLAATRLSGQPLPLRLWYAQPVYRSDRALAGHSTELMQAGVEMIGAGGAGADAEILSLASKLLRAGDGEYTIELSHAGLFTSLCAELGLTDEKRESARALIERKSFAALGDELEEYSSNPAARDLMRLMRLSGGSEVLEEAKKCECAALREPLAYLEGLSKLLPGRSILFDFGMVHSIEYYTGVVFRGYISGAAGAVLTGGRYDKLLSLLGRDAPAVGFAADLDALGEVSL